MNNINQLKESQREKHPSFESYLSCMTRSLFTGLATCFLSFSTFYFGQKVVQSRLVGYPLKYNILISALAATSCAYKVTSNRTKACQAAWMAAENKHTILEESDF